MQTVDWLGLKKRSIYKWENKLNIDIDWFGAGGELCRDPTNEK